MYINSKIKQNGLNISKINAYSYQDFCKQICINCSKISIFEQLFFHIHILNYYLLALKSENSNYCTHCIILHNMKINIEK